MKKYMYGMIFMFSLSLCAAQDEADRKKGAVPQTQEKNDEINWIERRRATNNLWNLLSKNLTIACEEQEIQEAGALLKQGADPNYTESNRMETISLLDCAIARESIEIIELLLKAGANPNGHCTFSRTLIGTVNRIHNARHPYARHPLHKEELRKILALLVQYGANVNVQGGFNGQTALMTAASHNDHETVAFLLNHGADDTIVNKQGKTFHEYAQKYEKVLHAHQAWTKRVQCKVEEILPQLPKEVTECIARKLGITDLDLALKKVIEGGTSNDVEAELKRGADPSVLFDKPNEPVTPCSALYLAARKSDGADKIQVLIRFAADVNQKFGGKGDASEYRLHSNCLLALLYFQDNFWRQPHCVANLECLVKSGINIHEPNHEAQMLEGTIRLAGRQGEPQISTNGCNFLAFILDCGADMGKLPEYVLRQFSSNSQIAQIIEQSKSKRLSAIDQSLQYMPAAVVNLIGQYSDCCLLEQPKKEKPDAGDEKE